jgi:hypothetical protein
MPDLTGSFVAHHAGPDGAPWCAHSVKESAVRRLSNSPKHFVTNACRMFAYRFEFNPKFFLGIILLEFLPDLEA